MYSYQERLRTAKCPPCISHSGPLTVMQSRFPPDAIPSGCDMGSLPFGKNLCQRLEFKTGYCRIRIRPRYGRRHGGRWNSSRCSSGLLKTDPHCGCRRTGSRTGKTIQDLLPAGQTDLSRVEERFRSATLKEEML